MGLCDEERTFRRCRGFAICAVAAAEVVCVSVSGGQEVPAVVVFKVKEVEREGVRACMAFGFRLWVGG